MKGTIKGCKKRPQPALSTESQKWLRRAESAFCILTGEVLIAFTITNFYLPSSLSIGGATGTAVILYQVFGIQPSVTVFLLNATLLVAGLLIVGKSYVVSTVFGAMMYPVFLQVLQSLPRIPQITQDKLLISILAASIFGAGIGLIIRVGASTGGSDALAIILNKLLHFSISTVMAVVDIGILVISMLLSDPENILYSIAAYVIQLIVMKRVMVAGKSQIQLLIVTKDPEGVRDIILRDLDAGATMLYIETGFRGENTKAVLCVIPIKKLYLAKEAIYSVDSTAFVTISEIKEVRGNGFTAERISLMSS